MEDPKGTSNRIIFDADFYDDSWWEEIVTQNQIDGDGFWTDLNPENIDDVVAADLIAEDLENEMDALASYLDGTMHCIDGAPATTAGNRLLVRGTVGLWDGTVSGFTPYDDLKSALDTSSSRFGGNNVMADCEIDMIWESDGSLFVSGFNTTVARPSRSGSSRMRDRQRSRQSRALGSESRSPSATSNTTGQLIRSTGRLPISGTTETWRRS